MRGAVRRIVSNTGPLISLEKLNQGHDFIRCLYQKLIIPPAVLDEVAEGKFADPQEYLQYYNITDLIEVRPVSKLSVVSGSERLHDGEIQAIQLALELQLPLLIEETVGRRVAHSVGIQISGIAGQIIMAFRQNGISAMDAQRKLMELFRGGRINRKIYDELLAAISTARL